MVTGIREIIITDWPRRSLQEVLERHYKRPLEEIKCEETKEVDFGNHKEQKSGSSLIRAISSVG